MRRRYWNKTKVLSERLEGKERGTIGFRFIALMTNVFNNEVTSGEPVATLAVFQNDVAIKGDAVCEAIVVNIVRHNDAVEVDAVPAVALSAVDRGLIEGVGHVREAVECREPHVAPCIAIGGNLLFHSFIAHLGKDNHSGVTRVGLSCTYDGRDTIAARTQVLKRILDEDATAVVLSVHMEIACLLVGSIVFTTGRKHILMLIFHRLVGELPVVAIQVVLIVVAEAVNLLSLVAKCFDGELGILDLLLEIVWHILSDIVSWHCPYCLVSNGRRCSWGSGGRAL